MQTLQAFIDSIHAVCPDFVVENVRAHQGEGQFNDILVINHAFIFRFARYDASIENLATEVCLLRTIGAELPLAIPNPTYLNLNATPAIKVFMGYRLIPGEPLWHNRLLAMTDNQILERIVNQLAGFLTKLHHLPIHDFTDELRIQDGLEEWTSLYVDIQQYLFPLMRPEARTEVSDHFEAYLHQPQLQKYEFCLRHGDFGLSNILYEPQTSNVTGIIDFDSAGLGDPAVDLAAISCYGESFFERFCAVYPAEAALLERARFYKGTFALQEALHGFKNNDRQAFDSGMAQYI
jgi:aminoglycoside 2''-phosphotransferase